jgi:hypothetical protein
MATRFYTTTDVIDPSRHWKFRVVRASLVTTTGCVVRAMLLRVPKVGPAFGRTCDITMDGYIESIIRIDGRWRPPVRIGTVAAVRDNLRRLADHCKLDDKDREALFEEFRKWIRRDHRAKSQLE